MTSLPQRPLETAPPTAAPTAAPVDRRHRPHRRWMVAGLLGLLLAALTVAGLFSIRSYTTYLLWQHAYELDAPDVSHLRPWMTIGYVVDTYAAPRLDLLAALDLPPTVRRSTSLRDLARHHNVGMVAYLQQVQRALVEVEAPADVTAAKREDGWLVRLGDRFLAAVLTYGYPLLGLTLVIGAVGVPLPTGLTVSLAGSLISQGAMHWLPALSVAVAGSVLGDTIGYRLGRLVSGDVLERRGRWLGYSRKRRLKAERFFARWGGMAVFLSRTLMSAISPALSLVAGASRYRFDRFLLYSIAGRIAWTGAYAALGYAAGANPSTASGFLTSLSVVLAAVLVAVIAGAMLVREARLAARPAPG